MKRRSLGAMIRIGMSTTCVYPLAPEQAFEIAASVGYDGIEIMVSNEPQTQDPVRLRELSSKFNLPVLSIHAPVLLLTHFVWGRDPQVKLERTAELAAAVGADSVVVHPPFRWQSTYARDFLRIVRHTEKVYGVAIAVENMFPWRAAGRNVKAYSPGPDPREMDCDNVTLDFSHAALSGVDSRDFVADVGDRLRHVHLCDGTGPIGEGQIFDEHLLPGRGNQPVAEVLRTLAASGWSGSVVAEVNTRKAKTDKERRALLEETLAFAREHTAGQGVNENVVESTRD